MEQGVLVRSGEYADGVEHSTRGVRDRIARLLLLTDEELRAPLPSRRALKYSNRVAWAHTYLKQALLLESPRRGNYRITERGVGVSDVEAIKLKRLDEDYFTEE